MAAAIAESVNRLGFQRRLSASRVADVAHNYLPASADIASVDLFGRVLQPTGKVRLIRSGEFLEIPHEPAEYSTGRTAVFVLFPEDVSISLVQI